MPRLTLKCRNCGRTYEWDTPYETYVGKPGEVEVTGPAKEPRIMFPVCPHDDCGSSACQVV